ncbi:sucrase ferredoxin [Pseudonocardia sp. C8]|uniref:sucrase ferredoxin n=1 Tax=Pseudonocardia sp. C8 TaxID=2762759 RepID=UPI001642A4F3|nr:sucrase ferredoxin [Pseudonocardia sp. C8]MBC3190670.1 sucrase ferredoxin [Pseudonocardia sp. C8]
MTVSAAPGGRPAADARPRTGCAALSEAAREPLAGTAPAARRVVAVEHVGAWPRTVADHPDPDVTELFERLRRADVRLLLIRRPGRAGRDCDGARTVYLADLAPGASRVRARTVCSTDELVTVCLDPDAGEPVTDPVLLVCAHGRRDVCCAVRGRALAAELDAEGADVWECTHLGGHRFAPTALVLPTGYAYGRLDTGSALAALKAAAGGNVDPWACRGHAGLEPAQQLAELAVREHTGIGDATALQVDAADGPGAVAVRATDGRVWTVDVRAGTGLPPRPPSCGAFPDATVPLVAGVPVELAGSARPVGPVG